jgi:hypothetical protein
MSKVPYPIVTTVVDDSSLCQARKNELKGKSRLVKFRTKPNMETSHVPTLQDNSGVS